MALHDNVREEETSFTYYDNKVTQGDLPEAIFPVPKSKENRNLEFGWACLTSKWLQVFNNPVVFIIVLILCGFAQCFLVGVFSTVVTSIERQFGLKSTDVSVFLTAYDATYGICCIVVGYIGRRHKPRCIGWGVFIMTVAAILLAVPKFTYGDYSARVKTGSEFCLKNATALDNSNSCQSTKEWHYEFTFILGKVLLGIGATPLHTLAPAHIDEVCTRGQGSLFMGIFYAICSLGPALAFILGLPILTTWVDNGTPDDPSMTILHPGWVGAWWILYIIGAGILVIPMIPMLGFAKEFPDTERVRADKQLLEDTIQEDKDLDRGLTSVWPATKALLTNAPYVLITLSMTIDSFSFGGAIVFIPKFIQTQFHYSAADSALYSGCMLIPGATVGIFFGGYIMKRFNWNCKQALQASTAFSFFSILFIFFALVGCPGKKVVGYENSDSNFMVFDNECNKDCHCSKAIYEPICSVADQKTYYSACHAGCTEESFSDIMTFANCSCLSGNENLAHRGRCVTECNLFPLFAVGTVIMLLLGFVATVPVIAATLRVVNEGQGSFAMGVQQIFVRLLGLVPGPLAYAALVDKACYLWQTDSCTGETTNCLEYDSNLFRYYLFAIGLAMKVGSFIFMFLAYKVYRLPKGSIAAEQKFQQLNVG